MVARGIDLWAYVPQDRRSALARGVGLPDRAFGAAMFADVAGFTPLAEALADALGTQRGAEELTALLNQVYGALIAQVDRLGGSVVGFSGDAITCWFDESRDGEYTTASEITCDPHTSAAVLRALTCALAMRDAMAQFAAIPTPSGATVALTVKIAVAGGPVRRFLLGDPTIQRLEVLAGPTLDRLSATADLAERDDVLVDMQTLEQIEVAVPVAGWREHPQTGLRAAAITELAQPARPCPWPALGCDRLPDEHVRPWLLPPVYARLHASPAPFLAELRPAVALMLQFSGIDYDRDEAGAALDAYISQVQQIVNRYEGILVDVTMADKGGYLYAAFGAPVAHEDDARRAALAALDLLALPFAPQGGSTRVGLSQGTMRTGPYGSAARRAYGVLGDEVNLACRLMSHALPGQALVSAQLQKGLADNFNWLALPKIGVKGKREPVAIYRLLGDIAPPSIDLPRAIAPPTMVGRVAERAALAGAVEKLRAGTSTVLVLEGEAGIGKTHLLADLGRFLNESGIESLSGAGQSIEQQTPYRAWRDIFTAYFELDAAPTQFIGSELALAERQMHVQTRVAEHDSSMLDRMPLLNDVLRLSFPETELSRALDPRLRSESLSSLLVDLLRARAGQQPLALILEDAHWLDSRSWELAVRVARTLADAAEQHPILLVLATRPLDASHPAMAQITTLLRLPGARRITLGALPLDDTLTLAAAQLGLAAEDLPEQVAALVRERAGGNPFFAQELISTLHEAGLIQITSSGSDRQAQPRCALAGDLQRASKLLPRTLQGLLLARIDRLPSEQQLTLKVASVVGTIFPYLPLSHTLAQHAALDDNQLNGYLRILAAQDFTWLEEPEPNLTYRFKHVLTQDAAYQTLLFAQRRDLHRTVAEWYEYTYADRESIAQSDRAIQKQAFARSSLDPSALSPYFPLLAHHYRQAEERDRERHYAWLAGIQAADQYANAEAVAYFTRALDLTPQDDLAARYDLLFEREAAEELLAAREAQARDLEALAALAEALDDNRRRAEIARSRERLAERVGNIAEMRVIAAQAVAYADAAGDPEIVIRAYDQWAWACIRAGAYDEARQRAESGLALARASNDRSGEAQLLTALGCVCAEAEDYSNAETCLEQSLQIFRELGRQRGESVALGNLGEIMGMQGDYAAARAYFEQGLRLYRMTGDRRNEGWILGSLGMAAMQLGDYAAARTYHEQAREIARATGDRQTESLALADLALVAHQLGDDATALEHGRRALELASSAYARIRSLIVLGHALAGLGRPAEAAARYGEAREVAQEAGLRSKVDEASAGLARVALNCGDLGGALALVEAILTHLENATFGGADEPQRIFVTCYRVLRAAADRRVDGILSMALGLLHTRAAKIPDARSRQMFLEQVPYHREIVAEQARSVHAGGAVKDTASATLGKLFSG
jgi:class 3 adenylate cyclase/tetratricopeptide (TPR) repeat protein